jgi:hypothetical protein
MSNYFDENCVYRAPITDANRDPKDQAIVNDFRKGFPLCDIVTKAYRPPAVVLRVLEMDAEYFGEQAMERAAEAWAEIEHAKIENQLARNRKHR